MKLAVQILVYTIAVISGIGSLGEKNLNERKLYIFTLTIMVLMIMVIEKLWGVA
jgi:hypothetical protein